jgi:putative phosphoesterase
MRIAVISDTHSRTVSVKAALAMIAGQDVEHILHCGDIQDADTVKLFPAKTHFVYGNCDDERDEIRAAVASIGATIHDGYGTLELAGKTIGFIHGDDHQLLRDLEQSNAFDFLFHGHTHIAGERRVGKTRVINPGALQRVLVRTYLVVDLASGVTESFTVP